MRVLKSDQVVDVDVVLVEYCEGFKLRDVHFLGEAGSVSTVRKKDKRGALAIPLGDEVTLKED